MRCLRIQGGKGNEASRMVKMSSTLEAVLAERLPNSGISAVPHIDSRVRNFRKKIGAIKLMLKNSGFTWDDNKKMIQCERSQYEAHCKVCPWRL